MSINTLVTAEGKFSYDQYHFASAAESNGFLFCSGVIGSDNRGKIPADISEEFHNAWKAVGSLLKEVNADYSNIMECTTYHVGLQDHMATFMAVRDEYLSEPWPAWTAIGITELAIGGAHVEIRVTARLPD